MKVVIPVSYTHLYSSVTGTAKHRNVNCQKGAYLCIRAHVCVTFCDGELTMRLQGGNAFSYVRTIKKFVNQLRRSMDLFPVKKT